MTDTPSKEPDKEQKGEEKPVIDSDFILGSLATGVAVYWLFIWRNLPAEPSWLRLVISVALMVFAAIIAIIALGRRQRRYWIIGSYIQLVFLALLAVSLIFLTTDSDRVILSKSFIVFMFTLLPAWLFLHFHSTRIRSVWDEYVVSLHRLQASTPGNLPEPPNDSDFYMKWRSARGATTDSRASDNLFWRKFEAVYGPVEYRRRERRSGNEEEAATADTRAGDKVSGFRAENLSPIAYATALMALGWLITVVPETFRHRPLLPAFNLLSQPDIPLEAFRFGFLGYYFFVLQMIVRRYFQNDLKPNAYVTAILRFVVAGALIWVYARLRPDGPELVGIAFVTGVFPQVAWQAITQSIKALAGIAVKSFRVAYPLSDIDGLSVWYEARLLEEGIEDMQNLATCDIVDAMLRTRIPIERLVDWIDQAILYLHLGGANAKAASEARVRLRQFGVRCASDLQDVCQSYPPPENLIVKLDAALSGQADGDSGRVRSILLALRNDPNLFHVRAWKTFQISNHGAA